MSVEIIIPCYNESGILKKNIQFLHNFCQKNIQNWQITIADNGSTDNTYQTALELKQKLPRVNACHFDFKGRGWTLKKIWSDSKADILIYMDADLSTNLNALPELIKQMANNDLVMASRYLPNSRSQRKLTRLIMSKVYNYLIKKMFKINIIDAQCGFKAINQKVVKNILPLCRDNYWFFDTELIYYCVKNNLKIKEIPVEWGENNKSSVRILKDVLTYLYSMVKFKIKNT